MTADRHPDSGCFSVLLVADATARELHGMLVAQGIAVEISASRENLLDELAQFQSDAVLIALADDARAMELAARLRQHAHLALLPVVVVQARSDPETRYAAISAGADDCLPVEAEATVLAATLGARVSRARLIQQQLPGPERVPDRRGGQLRRGEFLAQLGAVLRAPTRPWQVLIALRPDQVKSLAESLGQAGAYELEQQIAARFAPALHDDDSFSLWMEFGYGVLAERETRDEIITLCHELCRRIAQAPFEVRGESRTLTLSVGVALTPSAADGADPDRWFASAHAAQAIAHRLGGNRYDGVLSREHGSMPPERVLIIREWVKEAVSGENIVIEFQPILPLRNDLAGLYALDARLRDYRAPLAGVKRREYLGLARDAGALPMIDRMSLFSAFEAIEQERDRGRLTRVLVPMDLITISDALLVWLDAELRRRKAGSEGLIIEFDADMALGRPELVRVVQRLEDHGVVIAISDSSGGLTRMAQLQRFPAALLRLPLAAIESVTPEEFADCLAPWHDSGRGLIADQVQEISSVARLHKMQVSYVQGDALAAGGPRLDYEFTQFGT